MTRPHRPAQETRSDLAGARLLDDRALRTLHLQLLGRPPSGSERAEWLGKPRAALVDAVLGTDAFWRHWLEEQLYYFLLIDNFRPVGGAFAELNERLVAGQFSYRDALHRIALSPSFDLRNPGADTFVTVVMEQIVGMTVQRSQRELEIGKSAYDGGNGVFLGEAAENQSDVVRIAIEHRDAARHFVERESGRWLGTPLERREAGRVARGLHKDPYTFLAVLRGWLTDARYDERLSATEPLPNRLFVRALFMDLLGRAPTPDEAETLRGALDGLGDSRPLRSVVVDMLMGSDEVDLPAKSDVADPTVWVRDQFARLLGRSAAQGELRVFVGAFHEPDCRPSTLVRALLTDPAYHRY